LNPYSWQHLSRMTRPATRPGATNMAVWLSRRRQ
jgi:hypothetical protein